MKVDLDQKILNNLIAVLKKYPAVQKAVIFGSRAKGQATKMSDIDIGVYTDGSDCVGLVCDIEEASGIYKIDVVFVDRLQNQHLQERIEKEGVVIYLREV